MIAGAGRVSGVRHGVEHGPIWVIAMLRMSKMHLPVIDNAQECTMLMAQPAQLGLKGKAMSDGHWDADKIIAALVIIASIFMVLGFLCGRYS